MMMRSYYFPHGLNLMSNLITRSRPGLPFKFTFFWAAKGNKLYLAGGAEMSHHPFVELKLEILE